jgi:GTP-binding protein Era
MKSLLMPIIGMPNVGKSSLLNALIDEKVSIVCRKPHTTRSFIFSVKKNVDAEVVFVDTPGIEKVKGKLGTVIFDSMQEYLKEIDEMLLVLDATNPQAEKFADYIPKSIVILNKIDYLRKPKLLPLAEELKALGAKEIFFVCALTGDGIKELRQYLDAKSYTADIETKEGSLIQENIADFAAECVREKLLNELQQEIPYKLFVQVISSSFPPNSAWDISLEVIVPKKSYKPIVIGKKACLIKAVGTAVRKEVSAKLNQSGYLGIRVVVDESLWSKKEIYEALGWKI